MSGITRQSASSILTETEEFYTGGLEWYHGAAVVDSEVQVTLSDPDADDFDEVIEYHLSAQNIRDAYRKAKDKGYALCCKNDIESEGFGYGCAQDFDIVIQTACYGELVFS